MKLLIIGLRRAIAITLSVVWAALITLAFTVFLMGLVCVLANIGKGV